MAVKIMGVCGGRKNGNSEILLKEALSVCQEMGAEVTFVNLHDYDIKDCTGCTHCTQGMFMKGENVGCVLKEQDDKDKLMQALFECDGFIFGAPTYDLQVSANFTRFMQRSLAYETAFLEKIGAIETKHRVAGLIASGGSTRAWMSMSLETMQAAMFTCDFNVIDMLLATRVPAMGHVLTRPDLLERARKMGQNIMNSLAKAPEERGWEGDPDMGWCPNCHSNALVLGEKQWDGLHFNVECQVCGCGGNLEQDGDGKWKFVIDPEIGYSRDRTTVEGRGHHLDEIGATEGGFYRNPENMEVVKANMGKYVQMKFKTV